MSPEVEALGHASQLLGIVKSVSSLRAIKHKNRPLTMVPVLSHTCVDSVLSIDTQRSSLSVTFSLISLLYDATEASVKKTSLIQNMMLKEETKYSSMKHSKQIYDSVSGKIITC